MNWSSCIAIASKSKRVAAGPTLASSHGENTTRHLQARWLGGRRAVVTSLTRCGLEMRQAALHSGSLMSAPSASSCVAKPPSMTAHPPDFLTSSSTAPIAAAGAGTSNTHLTSVVALATVTQREEGCPAGKRDARRRMRGT
jgi:hypothetical protein